MGEFIPSSDLYERSRPSFARRLGFVLGLTQEADDTRLISGLNDHLLRDIGLTRGEISMAHRVTRERI